MSACACESARALSLIACASNKLRYRDLWSFREPFVRTVVKYIHDITRAHKVRLEIGHLGKENSIKAMWNAIAKTPAVGEKKLLRARADFFSPLAPDELKSQLESVAKKLGLSKSAIARNTAHESSVTIECI